MGKKSQGLALDFLVRYIIVGAMFVMGLMLLAKMILFFKKWQKKDVSENTAAFMSQRL